MYTAINIAKYIISYYYEHKRTVSNLKLQKLLYFIQAEFLVAKGERCFKEKIEAWEKNYQELKRVVIPKKTIKEW